MSVTKNIGFHFYNDTKHFTRAKLDDWFSSTGENASWICLQSSCETAIPQIVFEFCQAHKIRPIIQFDFDHWHTITEEALAPLLEYYQKQKVEFVQLGGYLNQRATWQNITVRQNFLHQIAESVIKFHRMTEAYGFIHVLPTLVPGGDLWDLVVLKYLFQQMVSAKIAPDRLVLSFVASINDHPLLWGKGGKRKWSQPQPYQKTVAGEDHRGLMGFEWYQEVAIEEFGKRLPVLLLETGGDLIEEEPDSELHFLESIFELMSNDLQKKLFQNVIGICFSWNETSCDHTVQALLRASIFNVEDTTQSDIARVLAHGKGPQVQLRKEKIISHYLLLPTYEWGIAPWHLEVALPFIRKYKPTIGYSVEEAKLAGFVTLVMDEDIFSQSTVETLQNAGCKVDVIFGDGTEIAALLAAE